MPPEVQGRPLLLPLKYSDDLFTAVRTSIINSILKPNQHYHRIINNTWY